MSLLPTIAGQASAQTIGSSVGNSSSAETLLNTIRDKLKQDGGWFTEHVTQDELRELNQIISSAPKDHFNDAFAQLSDQELKSWTSEIYDPGWLTSDGLSVSERQDLYANLAEKLDVTQQARFFNALETPEQQEEFASIIRQTASQPGFQSLDKDFSAALAKETQSGADFTSDLQVLLKAGFGDEGIHAYTSTNPHRDVAKEIEILHQHNASDCITTMKDVYRTYFGDSTIGTLAPGISFKHENFMEHMEAKGYVTKVDTFTFNDDPFTELQSATRLSDSVGERIEALGVGVYSLGIANGTHTMTLTYDGTTFKLHDQGTGWDKSFTSAQDLDAHLVSTTTDMNSPGIAKPHWSAVMHVYRLN
jgi:hypothetical protein